MQVAIIIPAVLFVGVVGIVVYSAISISSPLDDEEQEEEDEQQVKWLIEQAEKRRKKHDRN